MLISSKIFKFSMVVPVVPSFFTIFHHSKNWMMGQFTGFDGKNHGFLQISP